MTVLSLEKLIKEKVALRQSEESDIKATLFIPRLNSHIKLVYKKSDVRDFLEATLKLKNEDEIESAGLNLVYTVISEPNLKDKELQKAYECLEPTDIVKQIFTEGELADIITLANKKAGFNSGTVVEVDEIKN